MKRSAGAIHQLGDPERLFFVRDWETYMNGRKLSTRYVDKQQMYTLAIRRKVVRNLLCCYFGVLADLDRKK